MNQAASAPESTVENMAHLFRRAGFGESRPALEQAASQGIGATVDKLLAAPVEAPPTSAPPRLTPPSQVERPGNKATDQERRRALAKMLSRGRSEYSALVAWWIDVMTTTANPQVDKLVLVWHDHFATGIRKVRSAWALSLQQATLRAHALGPFPELVGALAQDPAMIRWLDLDRSTANRPNENFARELMELFTLGPANYTQADVSEAARAFTGWDVDRDNDAAVFRPLRHDMTLKTVLGETGRLYGDDVVDIVTSRRDSARHVARSLWSAYGCPEPGDALVDELADAYEAGGRRTDALLRAIFTHPQFYADHTRGGLIKTPVEFVVGALRALGVRLDVTGEHPLRLAEALRALGQAPFDPPNVGGWPQNTYWTNTAMTHARFQVAGAVAALVPEDLLPVPGDADSVRALFDRLGLVTTAPRLQERLASFTGSPRDLLRVTLASPAYQRN